MKHVATDDDNKLTDSQLKDNKLTTTAGLTWLVKFLGESPGVLDKLRASPACWNELVSSIRSGWFQRSYARAWPVVADTVKCRRSDCRMQEEHRSGDQEEVERGAAPQMV
jgi:hypothetical protein